MSTRTATSPTGDRPTVHVDPTNPTCRSTGKQGQPYRVWVQAHIKGPDGAPLLLGEKAAVLTR